MKNIILLIVSGIFLFQTCSDQKHTLMTIGHRGAMGHETENSLASVQKALDLGVDMIEIDVFEIKSKEIVVFHDGDVKRLTNGVGKIEALHFQEVQQLSLANGEKIPLLQDVLDLIDKKTKLNIELKGKNTAGPVAKIVKSYIEQHGWEASDFIISSFHWPALAEFSKLNPKIALGVLTSKDPIVALETAKKLNAFAIHPNYRTLNQENVDQIQGAGFKVFTWTVNELEAIVKMKSLGVDGIITDYPDRVQERLRKTP